MSCLGGTVWNEAQADVGENATVHNEKRHWIEEYYIQELICKWDKVSLAPRQADVCVLKESSQPEGPEPEHKQLVRFGLNSLVCDLFWFSGCNVTTSEQLINTQCGGYRVSLSSTFIGNHRNHYPCLR